MYGQPPPPPPPYSATDGLYPALSTTPNYASVQRPSGPSMVNPPPYQKPAYQQCTSPPTYPATHYPTYPAPLPPNVTVVMPGCYDAGARFDNIATQSIPVSEHQFYLPV